MKTLYRPFLLVFSFIVPLSTVAQADITFSALGCGPYTIEDRAKLADDMAREGEEGVSAFSLYLGDLNPGSMSPGDDYYAMVATLFLRSTIPVFVVPGDNEWNDHDDPERAWGYWMKYFLAFDKQWPDAPKPERQPERPENMAWVSGGVLFVGVNLVGGEILDPLDWHTRHAQNAVWVRKAMEREREKVGAAVVFCQALPTAKHEDFVALFREAAAAFEKPVLFLHADGHRWLLDKPWPEQNITRLMVDNLGAAPPARITVRPAAVEVFSFDRQGAVD